MQKIRSIGLILLLSLLTLVPSLSNAASLTSTTCPGSGCTDLNVGNAGSIAIQVTGTWVGTITFQSSVDNSTYTSLLIYPSNSATGVTTTTGNGVWTAPIAGFSIVRVKMTAYTSGTAVVTIKTASQARNSPGGSGGSGTVTSVGLALPTAVFDISGSPVTTTGTLTATFDTQTANTSFAGPTTGAAATPTFRALVAADIPAISLTTGVSGILPLANGGTASALVDPNADRILFWDDSGGIVTFLTVGTNLAISGTTLNATAGTGCTVPGADTQVIFNDGGLCGADAGFIYGKTLNQARFFGVNNDTIMLDTYEAIKINNTTFSSDPDDALTLSQYPDGSGSIYGKDDLTEIVFGFDGTVDLYGTAINLNGVVSSGGVQPNFSRLSTYMGYDNTIASGATNVVGFVTEYTNTDSRNLIGLNNYGVMGSGGSASLGERTNFSNNLIVSGAGADTAQGIASLNYVRVDIGAGYTQTTGPTPLTTAFNANIFGAIGLQQKVLNTANLFIQNLYNGSPSVSDSGALIIETKPGNQGDGNDATHGAATAYPVDAAIIIAGMSSGSGVGFTTGIRLGGTRGIWNQATGSKFGTPIDIQDYTTRGIYIHDKSGSPSAAIEVAAGNGPVIARYVANGSVPAVTNTTANSCGTTAATIAGNDNAFKVTVGATAGTSCTVTFQTAFSNAPSCSVSNETTANLLRATSTVSTVILAGTMVAGDVLSAICMGR